MTNDTNAGSELDGLMVGDIQMANADESITTLDQLLASGFEIPSAIANFKPALHESESEMKASGGRIFRARGQFGGFGLQGAKPTMKFKVMAAEGEENQDLLGRIVDVVVESLLKWALEQAKQRRIVITDLVIKELAGEFELVTFETKWTMNIEMQTEWDDTLVVFVGQTPYQFRPGEGKNIQRNVEIKGPNAEQRGEIHVAMYNTAGKIIEIIGNWSIDVRFKVTMNDKVAGEAHRNGWEGRGARFDYGPYYFGLKA